MSRIDKGQLAAHFGRRVRSYDEATPVQAQMALALVDKARAHFAGRGVARILELGCGTGRMTRQLESAFPQARITAVDIAPGMIDHARAASARVDFRVADAEVHLLHDAGEYDLVVSNAAAQWFEDATAAFARARALLSPGGLLAIATFGDQTFRELRHAFELAYAATGVAPVEHVVPMRSAESWRRDFPDAEIVEQIRSKVFPGVADFLRSVQAAGAVNSLAGRHFLSRAVLRAMMERYAALYWSAPAGGVGATYHVVYVHVPGPPERRQGRVQADGRR